MFMLVDYKIKKIQAISMQKEKKILSTLCKLIFIKTCLNDNSFYEVIKTQMAYIKYVIFKKDLLIFIGKGD